MANIKNFGIKGVAADIQFGKGGGFMVYDKSNNKFQVKDSGSSLEDIEFATVLAGTWAGTAIGVVKGGTGLTAVADGKMLYTTSANTFGATDITATGRAVVGAASTAAGRTALGLGSMSTQADTSVDINGGAIDGAIIGANTKAAIGGTTITATSNFVGDITGDVTGNADTATILATARTIGGVSFNGAANINLPGVNAAGNQNTSGSAATLTTGRTIASTGDVTWTSATFNGSGNVTGAATLATVNTDVGSAGSATSVPVITVNAKGLVTAVSTATIATSFDVAADSGSNDTIAGGETLTFEGTTNEVDTIVSANKIKVGLVTNPTIGGNLTVSGNFTVNGTNTTVDTTSMAVQDSLVSYATGNASDVVDIGFFGKYNDGTDDLATGLFRDANDGKFHFFTASEETITGNTVDITATGYTVATVKANTEGTHTGAVTGNVTGDASGSSGTVTSIAAHIKDEDNMASNSATHVPSQQSSKAYVDTSIAAISTVLTVGADSGSDDGVTIGTNTLTFNGTANEIETTVSDNAITIGLVNAPTVSGLMTAGSFAGTTFTGALVGNASTATLAAGATVLASARTIGGVSFNGSANINLPGVNAAGNQNTTGSSATVTSIAAHINDEDNMASNSATKVASQQSVKAYVDAQVATVNTGNTLAFTDDGSTAGLAIDFDTETLTVAGGTGLTTAGSGNTLTVSLDATAVSAGSYGSTTAIPVITVDAQGRLTSASTAAISTSWTLTGDSGTQTVAGGDTVDVAGGTNITTVASATDTLTVNLDTNVTGLTSLSATTVTGTTVTDGTASINAGAITGVTNIAATDLVLSGNLTVNGATTSVSSTNTSITDTLIELQSGLAGANSSDIGIILERGSTGNNGFMGWDESEDKFAFATTTAVGTATGALTLADAGIKVSDVLASGTVTYASLSDGAITITAFADEDNMASNSATLVPTQQSVKAYVDAQVSAVDDTVLRATFTANSSASSFNIGTMPSTAGRTYLGSKLTLNVSTAFAGGSVDGIVVNDGTNDLMLVAQNDPTVAGLYVVDLGAGTIAGGATVSCSFKQANGSTASVPTSGAVTATVEYQFYT